MKPLEELLDAHTCSGQTQRYVQHGTARDVIEAAGRAVAAGSAGDFERDIMMTLAAVRAEEFGVRYRKAAKIAHARVTDDELRETEAESEARFQRELAARAARHPETEQAAAAFLQRFAGSAGLERDRPTD